MKQLIKKNVMSTNEWAIHQFRIFQLIKELVLLTFLSTLIDMSIFELAKKELNYSNINQSRQIGLRLLLFSVYICICACSSGGKYGSRIII